MEKQYSAGLQQPTSPQFLGGTEDVDNGMHLVILYLYPRLSPASNGVDPW